MNAMSSEKIFIKLDWRDTVDGVECSTLASIAVSIDGTPAWPVTGEDTDDFEWFADELLSHLTECWKPLLLRQTYPIPVQPERPSYLMAEAVKRWASLPSALVETEQGEIAAFEDVHNLANAFGGISGLLPLWFIRDREFMIVDTQERFWHIPLSAAVEALTSAANQIADRLSRSNKEKWQKLIEAWQRRDEGDPTLLLALTIGRDRDIAMSLLERNVLEAPTSLAEAANDNNELRIAARMAGPLPLNQITKVLETVRSCDHVQAPKLTENSLAARTYLNSDELLNARPHVQGTELAKWFRGRLNLPASRTIDPFRVLNSLGVDFRVIDFGFSALYAVAVWGTKHGPAILLNTDRHKIINLLTSVWQRGATRVNAAHELCHLLVDSQHGFSAVDVLGGRMPLRIEQRAKAFAAEFLLPSAEAGAIWQADDSPMEPNAVHQIVKQLSMKYKVTEAVASWQLEHGVSPYHQESLSQILDQVTPHR